MFVSRTGGGVVTAPPPKPRSPPPQKAPAGNAQKGRRPAAVPLQVRLARDTFSPAAGPNGYRPDITSGPVTLHGGSALKSPKVIPLYVGAYWSTPEGKSTRVYNDAVLHSMATDPGYLGVLKQYGVGKGAVTASQVVPAKFGNPNPILGFLTGNPQRNFTGSQSDVQAYLQAQADAGRLKLDPSSSQQLVNIALPPGRQLPEKGADGYHGQCTVGVPGTFDLGPIHVPITRHVTVQYSVNSANPDWATTPKEELGLIESHEYAEAVTNPDTRSGWYAKAADGGEVGDIGVNQARKDPARYYPGDYNGQGYLLAGLWSNQDKRVEIRPKSMDAAFNAWFPPPIALKG